MLNFIRTISFIVFICTVHCTVYAQYLHSIHSRWNDDFSEWLVFTEDNDTEWYLGLKWPLRADFSEWEFEVEGVQGTIKLKWNDDLNLWESRGDYDPITARTIWKNDFSEWRITSGDIRLTLKSKWKNSINEWFIEEKKYGSFSMKTEWNNDPRDWQIYDNLDPDITLDLKMTLVFLVVFQSTPK